MTAQQRAKTRFKEIFNYATTHNKPIARVADIPSGELPEKVYEKGTLLQTGEDKAVVDGLGGNDA